MPSSIPRVSEFVLWGVTTTTRHEVEWLTWNMGEIYPEAFAWCYDTMRLLHPSQRGT